MRDRALRLVLNGAVVIGVIVAVIGATGSCEVLYQDVPTIPVQIGDLQLARKDEIHHRYRLTLSVYNGAASELVGFTLSAQVATTIEVFDDETDGFEDRGGVPADGRVETPVRLAVQCSVVPDSTTIVELAFPSPFQFVPASPIEMSDVGVTSLTFADGTSRTETIVYPYPVEEVP
ncbi:MAG: hypothetical protein ACLFR8_09140 [Alkalispirochaeta sp.]